MLRYVDDYLIALKSKENTEDENMISSMLRMFTECFPDLYFNGESPTDGALQFLDLNLR